MEVKTKITYFWILLFGGVKYQGGDKAEGSSADEQSLSDKTPLIQCEEI